MKKGFSLVELSISIIIIGLLVAGISGGSKLLKQAELRAVIAEMQNMKKDYLTFKTTYDAVPGDFANASVVFSNCVTGGSGNINCNGNGDGLITFNAAPSVELGDEAVRVFRHFNLSDISSNGGSAVLSHGLSSFDELADVNSGYYPAGKISGSAYVMASVDGGNTVGSLMPTNCIGSDATDYLISNFNIRDTVLYMVKARNVIPLTFTGVLTPFDAFSIDGKIDDGAYSSTDATGANTGDFRVITDTTGGNACVSGANYTLATTTTTCVPQLLIAR